MKRILSIFVILLSLCMPVTAYSICCPLPGGEPGVDWIFPDGFCDNILLVCPTSEYTTIAQAMAAAEAWDIILVVEGTYNEAVTFSQNNITLRAFGSPENTIITQAAGSVVSFGTKSGCTLDGFTVSLSAATANTDEAIYSNNDDTSDYNTVKNCKVTAQNAAGSTFALTMIDIDDGNFKLLNNDLSITQTNDHACYAIQNTAAHTSYYIGNTLTIDQQTTGAHGIFGFHHNAATSTMHCFENAINVTSTHLTTGVGYIIYASAVTNYVNNNVMDADTSGTGIMYGLYTGTGDTAYYEGNTIEVTTGDSDGEWAHFAVGTSYAHGNIVTGDGVMGTGGTIYEGVNQIGSKVSINKIPYAFPTDDGDAGEQLQTDGSGGLSWEDSGGGGAETDPIVGGIVGLVMADGGGNISAAVEGTDYLAPSRIDDTKGSGDLAYLWSADKIYDQLALKLTITDIDDVPVDSETAAPISSNWAYDHTAAADPHTGYCLESVFGDTIGTGLLKDGTTLKVSAILQEYHGVDPSAFALTIFDDADAAAVRTTIGAGTGNVSKVGTPANHEWPVWTGDGTAKGVYVPASKMVCTDTDGEPAAATTFDFGLTTNYFIVGVANEAAAVTGASALSTMETSRGDTSRADYLSSSTVNGIDNISAASYIYWERTGEKVFVDFRIGGNEAGTDINFTLPSTTADLDGTHVVPVWVRDGNGSGYTDSWGHCVIPDNGTTVNCYPSAAGGGSWNADNDEDRIIMGQFHYWED